MQYGWLRLKLASTVTLRERLNEFTVEHRYRTVQDKIA